VALKHISLPAICDISVTNVCNAACDFCGFARDKTLRGPPGTSTSRSSARHYRSYGEGVFAMSLFKAVSPSSIRRLFGSSR